MVKQINWRQMIVELFGIVFAVLLALWVDQWRDQRELNALALQQKQRIIAEVRDNMKEVFESTGKNYAVFQNNIEIKKMANWWQQNELVAKLSWSFVSADTKDANWRITLVSRAAQGMDNELLADASNIYKFQGVYDGYLTGMLPRLEDEMVEIERDPKIALSRHETRQMIMGDFSLQLLQQYTDFLQKYDRDNALPVNSKDVKVPGMQ